MLGLIATLRDHVLDRRQLVALDQQPQPQRLADLLDQLHVGGDAGAAIQMELDHLRSISSRFLAL